MARFKRFERELPIVELSLQQRSNATGRIGAAPWQNILSALRKLADGSSFSSLDDQARMSVETLRQYFRSFCRSVRTFNRPNYLNRFPNQDELRRLGKTHADRYFPGCIGSLDCMKIKWKNCPKQWKRRYFNPRNGKLASVQIEAVSDPELYCWHVHCGPAGTNNDITDLKSSPLILSTLNGECDMKMRDGYEINRQVRHWLLYYLTDGIYPNWAIFGKPITAQRRRKAVRSIARSLQNSEA